MKLRYIKPSKMSYDGVQYKKGDILELSSYGKLPMEWFEIIKEPEKIEVVEKIEKDTKKTKKGVK